MKAVQLSFAREGGGLGAWLYGHGPMFRWRLWAGAALLAMGIAALCVLGWAVWETQQEARSVSNAVHALRAQQGNAARAAAEESGKQVLSDDQRARWSRLARQLNTPWSALLDALESSLPDGVALVSIEPDAAQGSVRLQVEAKTLDALLAYAASLNATQPFQSVALVKHETNEQDPTRPLRLSLEAKLNGQVASLTASKEPAR
jgi:Tfp pilus assembly protein PilN